MEAIMAINKVPGAMTLTTLLPNSADYTLSANDDHVSFDATGAARTATLPAAASNSGKVFEISKSDSSANFVTITAANAGSDVKLCYQYELIQVRSNGTQWEVIGSSFKQKLISAAQASATNYAITAGQWGDLTNVALTPGRWRFRYTISLLNNGATTFGRAAIGISTTTGNSTTGLNIGENQGWCIGNGTSAKRQDMHIPGYFQTLTATTTYYAKSLVEDSITNLQYQYYIVAEKVGLF
jgi:hypothetical protein